MLVYSVFCPYNGIIGVFTDKYVAEKCAIENYACLSQGVELDKFPKKEVFDA